MHKQCLQLDLTHIVKDKIAAPKPRQPPTIGLLEMFEEDEMFEEKETTDDFSTSHYAQCIKVYIEYTNRHPNEFTFGDYVAVIEGEVIARSYKDFDQMLEDLDYRAPDQAWWYTIYGEEDTIMPAYNVTIDNFKDAQQ